MNESRAMVYSSCAEWLDDWIAAEPPTLLDEYDLSCWMDTTMTEAIETFLQYGFHSQRARNDAILILRALCYEYFLFEQQRVHKTLPPNPDAVERLRTVKQTDQKSAAWHAEARELLTSHEFGAICYGTENRCAAVAAKKCVTVQPQVSEAPPQRLVFTTGEQGDMSPLHWGWRYEPVVRQLFETHIAGGSVFDGLGRIRHSTHPRLAASPDGIILDGPRCGRLVEIKSPYSRELDGSIPIDYYCQMQLQAEVCDVEAVDYIEVRCGQKPVTDITYEDCKLSKLPSIGKVCVVAPSTDANPLAYKYEYSPHFPPTTEGLEAAKAWKPTSEPIILEESIWWVQDYFATTVPRNRQWWAAVGGPKTDAFWELVFAAREDGRFKPQGLFVDEEEPVPQWIGESDDDKPTLVQVKEEELK
jgi:hypothetical protein